MPKKNVEIYRPQTLIYPVQPYFVLNTYRYMKKVMRDGAIAHFYKFRADLDRFTNTIVVPDGSIDILITCDPEHPEAKICGSVFEGRILDIKKGKEYFGVRFHPGIVPKAFSASPLELAGHEFSLFDLLSNDEMLDRIIAETDFARQIDIFTSYLHESLDSYFLTGNAYLVSEVIRKIYQSGGNIKVDELAELTQYSQRYINKLFRIGTGISPKTFCRFIRFQRAIKKVNSGDFGNWAELSSELGYFDQSHFLTTFKEYTSMTPKQYLEIIQPATYKDRIFYL